MIVCESMIYVQELSREVGDSCNELNIFSQLDLIVTPQAMQDLLLAQWAVYLVFLTFAWGRYAIKNGIKI